MRLISQQNTPSLSIIRTIRVAVGNDKIVMNVGDGGHKRGLAVTNSRDIRDSILGWICFVQKLCLGTEIVIDHADTLNKQGLSR